MLDVIFVVATLALFGLVALIAKAVERTDPRVRDAAPRAAVRGEDRA